MKTCTNPNCTQKNPQELSAFSKDNRAGHRLQSRCKACDKAYHLLHYSKRTERNAQWAKKNPERNKANQEAYDKKHPTRKRIINIRNRFGLSLEQYEEMLAGQNGRCAICPRKASELKKHLSIDHDHFSGALRKLLCNSCNTGLGMFKDDPVLLRKAADYIEKHNAKMSNPQEVSGQEEAKDSVPFMSQFIRIPDEAQGQATSSTASHARQEEVHEKEED